MSKKRWFLALVCLVALVGSAPSASARIYVWPEECSCAWCAANMLERCAEAGGLFWCVPWFGSHCSQQAGASNTEEFLLQLESLDANSVSAPTDAEPAR